MALLFLKLLNCDFSVLRSDSTFFLFKQCVLKKIESRYLHHIISTPLKKNRATLLRASMLVVALFSYAVFIGQSPETDSLLRATGGGKNDSLKVNALINLAIENSQSAPDKSLEYAEKARDIASKINFKSGEAYAYKWLGIVSNYKGKYYDALLNSNKSLDIFEAIGDKAGTSNLLSNLGSFYADNGDDSKAVEYYLRSLDLAKQIENKLRIETALGNIGVIYSKNPETDDKALDYYFQALPYAIEIDDTASICILYTNIGEVYVAQGYLNKAENYYDTAVNICKGTSGVAYTYNDLGKLFRLKKDFAAAKNYFEKGYAIAKQFNSSIDILQSLVGEAEVQLETGKTSGAIASFREALTLGTTLNSAPELKDIYAGLASAYKKLNDYKNALFFQGKLNDLYESENQKKISFSTATLEYALELQKQSGKIAVLMKENKLQELSLSKERFARNVSIAGLAALLVFAIILLFIIRQRKKLNKILSSQKTEIESQKASVEKALTELKSTQAQLIQAEKMASLGELTAGIAHEIQNPLNFVNNFSEVNKEMIAELKEEVEKRNYDEVKILADDIEVNEERINHHGKRAGAILKSMLQHSLVSSGQKEMANINALCDEYLRLSYNGLRVKDKNFNAEMHTVFDNSIKAINIVPQDIGRVLLNLFNNAFYAVNEQKSKNPVSYQPTVWLSTKKTGNRITITVRDNGGGIPEKIKDKIFQPFFTTKPTGQGTGLGLSLSYDIIKAHGGEIKVDSKENEGTRFVIELPAA